MRGAKPLLLTFTLFYHSCMTYGTFQTFFKNEIYIFISKYIFFLVFTKKLTKKKKKSSDSSKTDITDIY